LLSLVVILIKGISLASKINIHATHPITYEKSYVAFLDVLGFKNLIYSKKKADKKKVENYFGIVNSAIEYLEAIDRKQGIGSIVISDSIVLSVPFGNTKQDNVEKLRQLCIAIALIQFGLALKDIWLRGAISFGDTYFDKNNNQVVGEAYINAYLLEEKLAITPRVILDNRILTELKFKSAATLISEINKVKAANWGKNILYDWNKIKNTSIMLEKDIPLFIDYFDFATEFLTNKYISTIIENIEKNMYHNTTLYKKFKWLSTYLLTKLDINNLEIKRLIDL
jgi:hypothetical protein